MVLSQLPRQTIRRELVSLCKSESSIIITQLQNSLLRNPNAVAFQVKVQRLAAVNVGHRLPFVGFL